LPANAANAACAAASASRSSFLPRRRRSDLSGVVTSRTSTPAAWETAQQTRAIAAGGFDADTFELAEGAHPGEHLAVALPGRREAPTGQELVTSVDDGSDVKILVGVDAANDDAGGYGFGFDHDASPVMPGPAGTSSGFAMARRLDKTVTRQNVRPFSGHMRRRGETSPPGVTGGRQVRGKTRSVVDRSVGHTAARRLAAPATLTGPSLCGSDRPATLARAN